MTARSRTWCQRCWDTKATGFPEKSWTALPLFWRRPVKEPGDDLPRDRHTPHLDHSLGRPVFSKADAQDFGRCASLDVIGCCSVCCRVAAFHGSTARMAA